MKEKNSGKFRISAVGDISLGDHPVCVGHGMRQAFSRYQYGVLKEVTPILKDSDITIGNLETVTSDHDFKKFWLPSYEMRGEPAHLKYLKAAGIDLVGVANNHSMQHDVKAFRDMLSNVENADIAVVGYDDSLGKTVTHKVAHDDGTESIIFCVSTRPEEWAEDASSVPYSLRRDSDVLVSEAKRLRESCSGFLICSIHWGLEFLDYPGPEQVELGHKLVDAGVDLIFGHHPHVLQPVERYQNALIFYSLGNFAFDLWPEKMKLSAIAQVTLCKEEKPEYSWVPLTIGNDLVVRLADKNSAEQIANLLSWERYQEIENKPQDQDAYKERYSAERRSFRYSSYRYFFNNLRKYPPLFLAQSLLRTGLRRLTGN